MSLPIMKISDFTIIKIWNLTITHFLSLITTAIQICYFLIFYNHTVHLMLFCEFCEFCESPPMHWTSSTIYTVLCLFDISSDKVIGSLLIDSGNETEILEICNEDSKTHSSSDIVIWYDKCNVNQFHHAVQYHLWLYKTTCMLMRHYKVMIGAICFCISSIGRQSINNSSNCFINECWFAYPCWETFKWWVFSTSEFLSIAVRAGIIYKTVEQ